MTLRMRTGATSFLVSAVLVTVFCMTPARASADIADHLVGHWALDEGGAATSAVDSVSGNNGTWQGTSPHYVNDGPSGVANAGVFSFDDGQYVDIPHSSSYDFSTNFSVSLWVKASTWNPWNALLAKDSWDVQEGWAIYINDQAGGLGSLCYEAPVHGTICTDHVVPLSTWVHIVVTNDHGTASIYVDQVQSANGSVPVANSSVDLFIGARHHNDGTPVTDNFIGAISDVRLYDRLLSSDDIQALHDRTSPSSSSSSVGTTDEGQTGGGRGHGTTTIYSKLFQYAPHPGPESLSTSRSSPSAYHIVVPSVTIRGAKGLRLAKGDTVDFVRFVRQGRLAQIRLPGGRLGYVPAKAISQ